MQTARLQIVVRFGKGVAILAVALACVLGTATTSLYITSLIFPKYSPYPLLVGLWLTTLIGLVYTFVKLNWRLRMVLAITILIACFALAPRVSCASSPTQASGC
jgi:hypothetical protein